MRHSLCSWLLTEGYNPEVARKMLRHTNTDMTLAYAHMDGERIDAQGRFLAKMIPGSQIQ